MALPFLKPKSVAGVIISHRAPDGAGLDEEGTEGNDNNGLGAAAADLIRAVHSKDEAGVASALQAAFDIMESSEGGGDEGTPPEGMES